MSFVIPEDFEFLKRSGRLTAITAKVGGMLKLLPILTQTDDKKRIKPIGVKRTWRAAVDVVIEQMRSRAVNGDYLISVCHTETYCRAQAVLGREEAADRVADKYILQLKNGYMSAGLRPLGYDSGKEPGSGIVNKKTAPIVKDIFRLCLDGVRPSEIAREIVSTSPISPVPKLTPTANPSGIL
jgi:hypothetical protein